MIFSSSHITKLWLLGIITLVLASSALSISHKYEQEADHHIAHECSLYEAIGSALTSDSFIPPLSKAPIQRLVLLSDQVTLSSIDRPRSRSPPKNSV